MKIHSGFKFNPLTFIGINSTDAANHMINGELAKRIKNGIGIRSILDLTAEEV